MEQTFEYPNLVSGTDEWTSWWTPAVGKENSCFTIATIALPRPIEQDDIVCVSVEMEFDRLDLTADKANLSFQGPVDNSWHPCNPFVAGFKRLKYDVFDGMMELSNTFRVNSYTYNTTPGSYNTTPVGHSKFEFGFRVDNCGGAAPCAASHGRTQREGRTSRMGTRRGRDAGRGGVRP